MAIGLTYIDLQWCHAEDNVEVTGYNLYFEDGTLIADVGLANSYRVEGLVQNTEYCFYYTAYDASGNESVLSNIICGTTTITPNENSFKFEITVPAGGQLNLASSSLYGDITFGDGTTEQYYGTTQALSHTYTNAGTYEIWINGVYDEFAFADTTSASYLVDITQWGDINSASTAWDSMFKDSSNLATISATDYPVFAVGSTTSSMFENSVLLTCDIDHWVMTNVTDTTFMFQNAQLFNSPVDSWDVSGVNGSMQNMFSNTSFNQPINSWDVSNVVDANGIFQLTPFNQPLNNWVLSSALQIDFLFRNNTAFNQDLSSWTDMAPVGMSRVFEGATAFNQDISTWDTSNVDDMGNMFEGATAFNQDISGWDVSSLLDATNMFKDSIFNQNIGSWNISNLLTASGMFLNGNLSVENYNQLLAGWSTQTVQPNVVFHSNAKYNGGFQDERDILTNPPNNWIITDDGVVLTAPPVFNNPVTITDSTLTSISISWLASSVGLPDGLALDVYEFYLNGVLVGSQSVNDPLIYTFQGLNDSTSYNLNVKVVDVTTQGDLSTTIQGSTPYPLSSFIFKHNAQFSYDDIYIAETYVDGTVDWGDGTPIETYNGTTQILYHEYSGAAPGSGYTVTLSGEIYKISFSDAPLGFGFGNSRIFEIVSWGNTNADYISISGLSNLATIPSTGQPLFKPNWDATEMFRSLPSLNLNATNIATWDISNIAIMDYMFADNASYTTFPIGGWDVSNVTSMKYMFFGCTLFNQDLDYMDIGNVTDISHMFHGCLLFNQPLPNWDTSSVKYMTQLFYYGDNWNQDVSTWDVSNLLDANNFQAASTFTWTRQNYNLLLASWSQQPVQPNVIFRCEAKYSPDHQVYRDILTNAPNNWTISDQGI